MLSIGHHPLLPAHPFPRSLSAVAASHFLGRKGEDIRRPRSRVPLYSEAFRLSECGFRFALRYVFASAYHFAMRPPTEARPSVRHPPLSLCFLEGSKLVLYSFFSFSVSSPAPLLFIATREFSWPYLISSRCSHCVFDLPACSLRLTVSAGSRVSTTWPNLDGSELGFGDVIDMLPLCNRVRAARFHMEIGPVR